jgi:NAD(P)-dependent dehydrogenase (short-subunit alcohol dehydrogenase family)
MASTSQLKIAELFSVKGYVCVVTGGGTGIGLMCTQALAANGGFGVLCSVNERERNGGNGGRMLIFAVVGRSNSVYHRTSAGGFGECGQVTFSRG